jgi:ABC-type transport system substrate-binding protein
MNAEVDDLASDVARKAGTVYHPLTMARRSALVAALALALTLTLAPPASAAEGQITFAVNITLAPTWFDPAETPGVITPFLTLYALHDALVKPMPGNAWAPSLAESWTALGSQAQVKEATRDVGHPGR